MRSPVERENVTCPTFSEYKTVTCTLMSLLAVVCVSHASIGLVTVIKCQEPETDSILLSSIFSYIKEYSQRGRHVAKNHTRKVLLLALFDL